MGFGPKWHMSGICHFGLTNIKSYERGTKKRPLEVWSIFTFGMVRWRFGKIAADFYPQLLKNRLLQPVYLLRIVTQLVKMLACLLPSSGGDKQMTFLTQLLRRPVEMARK